MRLKLPVFSSREAQQMLRKLDVEFHQTREMHAYFRYEGDVVAEFTFPATHGRGRDLSPGERRNLQRDSKLSRLPDFIRLVNCPMRHDEYVEALKKMWRALSRPTDRTPAQGVRPAGCYDARDC